MKRSSFLKSLLAIAAAPLVIVKAKGQQNHGELPTSEWAIWQCSENLRKWCHETGKSKEADKFVAWYINTATYWLNELKKDIYFFNNKGKATKLAQFEGQHFENLWKLFSAQH